VRGYAISSAVAEAPITEAMAVALTKNLRRLEAWWDVELYASTVWEHQAHVDVKWSPTVGDMLQDPGYAVVHVVDSLPDAPQDIAYHTVDEQGRPVCLISWAAVLAEGGTLTGPDGLTSAIGHEILESRVDPTCLSYVPLPQGGSTPLEVCDWVQGSDYCEPGSPDVYVPNAVGPMFFVNGKFGRLDIASDLSAGAVTQAFQETPGGYHEVEAPDGTVSNVFGERVPEVKRLRIDRVGPRGGLRRCARL